MNRIFCNIDRFLPNDHLLWTRLYQNASKHHFVDDLPLRFLFPFQTQYHLKLIVSALVQSFLEKNIFARVHTFGKALGAHGAIVLGSKTLRDYLINYARPFIYSTALPFHSLVAVRCAYELMKSASPPIPLQRRGGQSPIMSIVIPGNEGVRK